MRILPLTAIVGLVGLVGCACPGSAPAPTSCQTGCARSFPTPIKHELPSLSRRSQHLRQQREQLACKPGTDVEGAIDR